MAVAEDDRFDLLGRELEAAHVADEAAGRQTGVEEDTVVGAVLPHGHQGGEAVLSEGRVQRAVALREGGRSHRRLAGHGAAGAAPALGRALVHHQHVAEVVDQGRDMDRVYGLQRDVRHRVASISSALAGYPHTPWTERSRRSTRTGRSGRRARSWPPAKPRPAAPDHRRGQRGR